MTNTNKNIYYVFGKNNQQIDTTRDILSRILRIFYALFYFVYVFTKGAIWMEGEIHMSQDMELVKKIIQKARELFSKDFDYIVDCPAEISFREDNGDFVLEGVIFVAEGGYQDEISISAYMGPVITLEEGMFEALAQCEGFEQFLALEAKDLLTLPEYFSERVLVAKEMK